VNSFLVVVNEFACFMKKICAADFADLLAFFASL
jgi:hypothetical protein